MNRKNQSERLSEQHKQSHGVENIFGSNAKSLDNSLKSNSKKVLTQLQNAFPQLTFRIRDSISKEEINALLNSIDPDLG